jgi:glycine cleavage system transcriptional repressor
MIHHAVLTAIGADRPGLVDDVSQFILQAGGNIEDSRMVNLHGQFAMMLLVGALAPALTKLETLLPQLQEQTHLHAELHRADVSPRPPRAAIPCHLSATAMDQPGLVHRIANLLKAMDINIEDLRTSLTNAPITGTPLFELELTMSVPAELPLSRLRQSLGALCDQLNIDWQLRAV